MNYMLMHGNNSISQIYLLTGYCCLYNDAILFRIDFLPNTRETKALGGKGCLRCGYSVFEAEKLIAAGRVRHITSMIMQ